MDDVIKLLERVRDVLELYEDARRIPDSGNDIVKYRYCDPAKAIAGEVEAKIQALKDAVK